LLSGIGTFIAQSRNTSITSTEHGHTRGLDRGFQGDRFPASLAKAKKAHHGSRPQRIAPRLPWCCVSPDSPEQPRTRFSASTGRASTPECSRTQHCCSFIQKTGGYEPCRTSSHHRSTRTRLSSTGRAQLVEIIADALEEQYGKDVRLPVRAIHGAAAQDLGAHPKMRLEFLDRKRHSPRLGSFRHPARKSLCD